MNYFSAVFCLAFICVYFIISNFVPICSVTINEDGIIFCASFTNTSEYFWQSSSHYPSWHYQNTSRRSIFLTLTKLPPPAKCKPTTYCWLRQHGAQHPGNTAGASPKLGTLPADIQPFINQRVKLRCDLWRPDFRPPDKGRSKMDTPLREMRSRGYVLKQNAPFRAIVKRDTPPGWTAILAERG